MNNETIDLIVADKAFNELKQLRLSFAETNRDFLTMASNIDAFAKKGFKVKTPAGLNGVVTDNESLNRLFAAQAKQIEALEKKIKKLSETRKRARKQTQEEITNNGILRRNATQYAKANSTLATSYEKLSSKLNIMKRRYKDLATNQIQGNKLTKNQVREMKRLERQIRKTDSALKKVDKSVGESFRKVGDYGLAWRGLTKIIRASIAAFGLYSGIQIAKSIFEDIKAIDAMNKALLQVTETQGLYNRAKQFTADLAEEAGVDIIDLTKSYTKFTAAAKTTNLTLEQTENIFRQTAKAGAVLGLAQDDINGSFRALEQILSKGKVQAEEIRGQLGERLPGSFQILAKSMGLTTAQLSKQLELGNVLSEKVLPGFAEELANVYSLDKIKRVETLTSEQARLGNQWTLLVESFEKGEGKITKALVSIMSTLGDFLELIREANREMAPELENQAFDGQIARYKELGKEAAAYAKIDQARAIQHINDLTAEKNLLEDQNKQYKANSTAIQRFAGDGSHDLRERNERLEKINIALSTQKGIVKAATQTIIGYVPPIKEATDAVEDLADAENKKQTALKGSIGYYVQLISELENTRNKTATTSKEFGRQTAEIEKIEAALKKVKIAFNGIPKLKTLDIGEVVDKTDVQIEAEKQLAESVKKTNDELTKRVGITNANADAAIEDALRSIEAEKELRDNQFNLASETSNALNEIANAFTQGELDRIDDREERLNNYYDRLLENENLSQEARDILEIERDAKQAELQKKREKAEKTAFLVQQGFALAQIGIDLARTIVAINLAAASIDAVTLGIGGTAYRVANIPFAIGVAGAQTAAVLAQTIPAFKGGHESGTYEGLAKVNDQRGSLYQEIIHRSDGSMEMFSGRDQIINMSKGDKVYTASKSNDIINHTILDNILSSNGILPSKNSNQDISKEVAKGMQRGFSNMPKQRGSDVGEMAKAVAKEMYLLKQIDRI